MEILMFLIDTFFLDLWLLVAQRPWQIFHAYS